MTEGYQYDPIGNISSSEDAAEPIRGRSTDRVSEASGEQDGIQVSDLGAITSQTTEAESPTVAVARERLVEAIGREAGFLADQRAGQASEGLERLARAFALVTSPDALAPPSEVAAPARRVKGLAAPVALAKDFVAGGVSSSISKQP